MGTGEIKTSSYVRTQQVGDAVTNERRVSSTDRPRAKRIL